MSKIGVFDSGFGGLDILRRIVKKLPQYEYVYLGDTARTPYGTRTKDTIYKFTEEAVDFLFKKNCELVILACNTASSDALRKIQKNYLRKHKGKRVLGVLIPASEEAVKITKNGRVGIIATEATVLSRSFEREIKKLNREATVFQSSAPLLVPFVEAGEHNSELARIMLRKYLTPLMKAKIDTLVLGCTHYGILEAKIRKITGKRVSVISEARVIPKKLEDYLARHPEIEGKLSQKGTVRFFSTDLTPAFSTRGSEFYGKKIRVQKAVL